MKKIKYVCGFCFNYDRTKVALIKKERPDWQKGKLNGIGGHIEDGEDIQDAMQREFLEETGTNIWAWNLFCTYEGEDYTVYFMKAFSSGIFSVTTTTDEEVKVYNIDSLNNTTSEFSVNETIPNLKWLIPIALDIRIKETECIEYNRTATTQTP